MPHVLNRIAGVAVTLVLFGAMAGWQTDAAVAAPGGLTFGGGRTPTGGNVWAIGNVSTPGGRPVKNPCRNEVVDPATLFEWPYEPPFDGGVYFVRVCGNVRSGWRWADSPMGRQLYNTATLELPRVYPSTAPGVRNEQLVGVPVWLWIDATDWRPQRKDFMLNGVQVGLFAAPERVEWDMGDGHVVVCDTPGTPFDVSRPANTQTSDCTYTYTASSLNDRSDRRFRVVARAVWSLQWFASQGPFQDLGTVAMEQPFTIRVAEAQAILTPGS